MTKIQRTLILTLLSLSGLYLIQNASKNKIPLDYSTKQNESVPKNLARKKWEATPAGIEFNNWKVSSDGRKVYRSESNIRSSIQGFTNMNAVITSLSLPRGARLGYGMMVNIHGDDFILSFGPELKNEFHDLRKLSVGQKIVIKSHHVSHAPKYSFPIISAEYIEFNSKILYNRSTNLSGC
jgi:hypothetical protein